VNSVEQYLDRLSVKDWDGVAATLADESFERIGPFADVVSSKDAYLRFLSGIVSQLGNYGIKIDRITDAGKVLLAEIHEIFDAEGQHFEYPEALVFEIDARGLINHVSVYLMRPGEAPPVAGGSAVQP
jgi:SnoaL-like protein